LALASLIVRDPLEGSQKALHSPFQRWCGMTAPSSTSRRPCRCWTNGGSD